MASTMAELEAENANITHQHREWQEQRRAQGEDVNDWSSFRAHLMAIGAPDPGESETSDFRAEGQAEDMQTTRETQTI